MPRRRLITAFLTGAVALVLAPSAATAATAPVAAYSFDETGGSTATDASANGNNGTVTGATRTSAGRFGRALSFDGASDMVRIPDAASLDLTTGMTLEAWVYPMSGSGWRTVVMKERPGSLAYALYSSAPGTPSAQLTSGSPNDYRMADGASALPIGVWSHLAASFDGATLRLFVNGTQVDSEAYAGSLFQSASDVFVGGNSVWSEWFDGMIDEVRIYDRALTAAEITTDMATPITPGADEPPVEDPPGADESGSWTAPANWPLVAVHASMLSNGKVAMWDAFGAAMGSEKIWDPATGAFQPTPSGLNLFCAGHVLLPDGRLFSAGGHVLAYAGITDTVLLNPLTGNWAAGPEMARGRWYPTSTTLADGRVLIVSGDGISDDAGPYNAFYRPSDTIPEIYDPATNTLQAVPSAARRMPLYPFMFVAPDGRVVDAGPDRTTRLLNVQTGQWSTLASQSPIDGHSAVMYRPGKILKSGTWADPDFTSDVPVTNRAAALDLTETVPTWRETSPMKWRRTYHTLTVLPDGDVLAMGGTRSAHGNDVTNTAVLEPEIWDPETDTWTSMASSVRPRGYHNTSMLLPDGRIMLAGSGRLDGSLMPNETTSEIFSPPYLHKGSRPAISSAPDRLRYGTSFTVQSPDADRIAKVTLVRTGSVTHGLNMDQRYQELPFHKEGNSIVIDAPANSNLAPPGVYYVFLVDGNGVPSIAKILPLLDAGDTTAPSAPVGVAATTNAVGKVTVSWNAATDNVGVTGYAVHRSTTPGFTPSAATRVASVTPTTWSDDGRAPGTYYYRVVAEDAAGNASAPSAEATGVSLADTTAPSVAVSAPLAGSTVRGSVPVSATASDDVGVAGVRFQLDGANLGAEDTTAPYSINWDVTTATPGPHTLTAIARDAAGNPATSAPVAVTVDNSAPAGPAPVAAYAFEEASGTSVSDASGRAHTGTVSGATRTATGKNGRALSFDGVNDSVSIPDANDLDLTTGMTLEAWVNPTNNSGWRTAILKERTGDLSYALYSGGSTVPMTTITTTGAGGYGEAPGPAGSAPPVNTWTHLATTYDGTTLRLFRNGTQIASSTRTGPITVGTGPLRLGGNGIWPEWFAGQLDDVRVYDTALTPAQIQADMSVPVGGAPAPDTTAPTVPAGVAATTNAVGKVTVSWNAATDNVGVTGYGVYRSTTSGFTPGAANRVAAVTGTTWSDEGRAPGTYYYRVVAEDAAGNASAPSAEATGVSLADTTAPTVSLTAPAAGAIVRSIVSVSATAGDDGGVAGVQFKLDGANLGAEDTTAPYSVSWDTTTASAGPHSVTAIARDAAGNPATSAPVAVTVDNSVPAGPAPVAAYGFEELSGTSVTDASGRAHTGTVSGATRTTTGKTGRALSFDGVNDSVSIPDANDLDLTTGMTLEAWVNPTNNSGWRTAILKERTGDLSYALYSGGSTVPMTTITNTGLGGYGEAPGTSGSAPPVNTWTHLAGTYDGTTLRLYRNGTLIASSARAGSIAVGTGPLRLGGNGIWPEWFRGQLDDVRVYDTALTAAQIQADMATAVG